MNAQHAFRPNRSVTTAGADTGYTPVNVTPGAASSAAVALVRTAPINAFTSFRIANVGADSVGLSFGAAAVGAADINSIRLLPNSVEVFDLAPEITHFRHIAFGGGGANLLQFVEGNGV